MDCSQYSYYISEYIDGRLELDLAHKVEKHLKECGQCKKLYEDIVSVRDLFRVKKRENPKPEYYENLKSNIRKRILTQDKVKAKKSVLRYFIRPSWKMVASVAMLLMVSLSFNVYMYKESLKQRQSIPNQVAFMEKDLQKEQDQISDSAPSGFIGQQLPITYASNNGNANSGYYGDNGYNGGNASAYYSQAASNNGGSFVLRPISVKNIALRQAKIYQ